MMALPADRLEQYVVKGIHYNEALDMQAQFAREIRRTPAVGRMFYFEPTPIITFGKQVTPDKRAFHLFASDQELEWQGIDIAHIDRGGGATYHGPGHLVGFPVFNLEKLFGHTRPVKRYVEMLEEGIIRFLGEYGIDASRKDGFPGIWTSKGKIGFVGIRIRDGLPHHGFGLNICNPLGHFRYFLPCNIQGCHVTSMKHMGVDLTVEQAASGLTRVFQTLMNEVMDRHV